MNADEQQKQRIAALFSRASDTYSTIGPPFFQHFASILVSAANLKPGEKVLDVACGRGAVLFEAARRVTESGEVVGIDLSPGMVAQTSEAVHDSELRNLDVLVMDAEQLDFPDTTFDAVLCGFGIFFLPHMAEALKGFVRVLKPGGRLAVSTWGEDDERWRWIEDVVRAHNPDAAPDLPLSQASMPRTTKTVDAMRAHLAAAGLTEIEVSEHDFDLWFRDKDEYLAVQWSHGARVFLEMTPPSRRDALIADIFLHLDTMITPQGIPQRLRALISVGRKPA